MKTTLRLTIAALGLATFNPSAATLYVSLESMNPVAPFISWTTAATNIQDAVDAAKDGDTVLVTNGVYASGGRAVQGATTNRVAVTKPITLLSVNGPDVTAIIGHQAFDTPNGEGATRCVYLAADAFLSGFTLTRGGTTSSTNVTSSDQYGGGIFCDKVFGDSNSAIVSNCVVVANAAYAYGGGVWGGRLYNCTLERNSVKRPAGGGGGGKGGNTL
jgi:hypothetical protein